MFYNALRNTAIAAAIAAPTLALGAGTAVAGPQDFRLVNQTGARIVLVNIMPAGSTGWGRNQLKKVLPHGQSTKFTYRGNSDRCFFKFRVKTADNRTLTRDNVNFCKINKYTVR